MSESLTNMQRCQVFLEVLTFWTPGVPNFWSHDMVYLVLWCLRPALFLGACQGRVSEFLVTQTLGHRGLFCPNLVSHKDMSLELDTFKKLRMMCYELGAGKQQFPW